MAKSEKHIAFILDRSGSMSTIWDDVLGGYKAFVKEQKKQQPDAKFTLTTFDTAIERPFVDAPLASISTSLKNARPEVYPRGSTALLDAVGETVSDIDKDLKHVMVVIFTDGYENASVKYTNEKVKSLIEKRQKAGWGFLFLAADQDAFQSGSVFGMQAGSTMSFDSSMANSSSGSIRAASAATSYYFSTGETKIDAEYDPEKDKASP